jgi:hypothetical protein
MAETAPKGPEPTPATAMPSLEAEKQLALEIGQSVIGALRKAAAEGRMPASLLPKGATPVDVSGEALLRRPDAPPEGPNTPAAKPKPKRPPGTQTIRAAIRRAQDIASAPPGSELARLRIVVLVIMLSFAALATLIAVALNQT